jgi:hypothetical protein
VDLDRPAHCANPRFAALSPSKRHNAFWKIFLHWNRRPIDPDDELRCSSRKTFSLAKNAEETRSLMQAAGEMLRQVLERGSRRDDSMGFLHVLEVAPQRSFRVSERDALGQGWRAVSDDLVPDLERYDRPAVPITYEAIGVAANSELTDQAEVADPPWVMLAHVLPMEDRISFLCIGLLLQGVL